MQESIPNQDVGAIGKKIIADPGEVIEESIEAIDEASEAASETLRSDEQFTIPVRPSKAMPRS